MDPDQQQQQTSTEQDDDRPYCCRCRCRCCSCSFLGLVDEDDEEAAARGTLPRRTTSTYANNNSNGRTSTTRTSTTRTTTARTTTTTTTMTTMTTRSTTTRSTRSATATATATTTTTTTAKTRTRRRAITAADKRCRRPPYGTTSPRRAASAPLGDKDVLRRRPPERSRRLGTLVPPYLATLLILSYGLVGMADACSSRSTPKPRPPTPTPRPNITFHMYTCPPDYAEWYCLNGATCFTVKIVDSLLYNCLCANGYIGQRCEFKDLDGSYLPSRQRVMLETASIAGAVTIAVFLAVITFISVYIHCKRKQKELRTSSGVDAVDGPGRDPELRPFCSRSRSLMIFMAKNSNSSTTPPSIEQTRMPNWNYTTESSTRMTCINETKHPSQ